MGMQIPAAALKISAIMSTLFNLPKAWQDIDLKCGTPGTTEKAHSIVRLILKAQFKRCITLSFQKEGDLANLFSVQFGVASWNLSKSSFVGVWEQKKSVFYHYWIFFYNFLKTHLAPQQGMIKIGNLARGIVLWFKCGFMWKTLSIWLIYITF